MEKITSAFYDISESKSKVVIFRLPTYLLGKEIPLIIFGREGRPWEEAGIPHHQFCRRISQVKIP